MAIVLATGRDWVAFGVAAYGAVVATSVAAYQFVRDRPGVRLFIATHAYMRENPKTRKWEETPLWSVRVVNHRNRPIAIRYGGLLIEGKTRLTPMFCAVDGSGKESPFPITLSDGESVEFFVLREDDDGVSGAWVTDALDRDFRVRHPSRDPRKRWEEWRWQRRTRKRRREHEAGS